MGLREPRDVIHVTERVCDGVRGMCPPWGEGCLPGHPDVRQPAAGSPGTPAVMGPGESGAWSVCSGRRSRGPSFPVIKDLF